MAWKTGWNHGEFVGWSAEQVQRQARRSTLVMAARAFDVVVASHANLRTSVKVKVMDRRASRAKIVVCFANLEATNILRNGATVKIERWQPFRGKEQVCWYIVVQAEAFEAMLEKAGVTPEEVHGYVLVGPPATPLPPAPPMPGGLDYPPPTSAAVAEVAPC